MPLVYVHVCVGASRPWSLLVHWPHSDSTMQMVPQLAGIKAVPNRLLEKVWHPMASYVCICVLLPLRTVPSWATSRRLWGQVTCPLLKSMICNEADKLTLKLAKWQPVQAAAHATGLRATRARALANVSAAVSCSSLSMSFAAFASPAQGHGSFSHSPVLAEII